MIENEFKPDRLYRLLITQQAIRLGKNVNQEDFKSAVMYANELSEDSRNNVSGLAIHIANRYVWTHGTEEQISLNPDVKLAQELEKLQNHAIKSLENDFNSVPYYNEQYLERSDEDIRADEDDISEKIERVEIAFKALIDQATPKEGTP